jgi:hypothetical protein
VALLCAALALLLTGAPGGGERAPTARARASATPPALRPRARQAPVLDVCHRPALRLRCPDLVMLPPSDVHLVVGPDGRQLLAARNTLVNIGPGPLLLHGTRDGAKTMRVSQVIQAGRGAESVTIADAGSLEFYDTGTRGSFWKYEAAARFELWRIDGFGVPGKLVRTGPKLYYCLRDLRPAVTPDTGRPYPGAPATGRFGYCSADPTLRTTDLGMSVGWDDSYPSTYPQNWIDVTGLSGCFAYVMRIDPGGHLLQAGRDNDAAATVVRLPWGRSPEACPDVAEIPTAAQALAQKPLPDDGS